MNGRDREEIRVLYLSAEAEPFARVGGLGDVAGALPKALRRLGQSHEYSRRLDVRLVLPYYGSIKKSDLPVKLVAVYDVPTKKGPVSARVFETLYEDLPVYLIDGDPIHPDEPIYTENFKTDAEKFIFFSLASLQLPREINWHVDLIHANDWHSAAAIHQLKRIRKKDAFYAEVKGVISIHNLPFMGEGARDALHLYQVSAARNPLMPPWSRLLPLPMGIDAADWILTVSPHYAREILTPAFGCDLQDYLKTKLDHLSGILNGLDTDLWNPASDRWISSNYTLESLTKKAGNKTALQAELDLPVDPQIPLLAFVGRMEMQKGADLLLKALSSLSARGWQAVILGTGKKDLEDEAARLQAKFPDQVRAVMRFDTPLSHRIYAGADMLLMPSRYEPCGLAQMIAMRYGCIPIASATGGLVDSIINHTKTVTGTGFLFDLDLTNGLQKTIRQAFTAFSNPVKWREIQIKAMTQDHSWQYSALEYALLYERLTDRKPYSKSLSGGDL